MMARKFAVLLIVVLCFASMAVWAQTRRADQTAPDVISGDSVGIRVSATPEKDGKVRGTLVVKINGKWVDVVDDMSAVRIRD
jgi:hypothetical protein